MQLYIKNQNKMKKIILLFSSFLLMKISYSQIIKIDNGFSITNLKTKKFDVLHTNISSYCGFIGIDYFNRKRFYLSSQIGYIRIGGKETNEGLIMTDSANYKVFESFNYGQVNTTFRIQDTSKNTGVYLGVGPYLNILLDSDKFDSRPYESYIAKKLNFGFKTEVGFMVRLNKIILSLNGAYLINISPMAKSAYNSFTYKAIIGSLTIGYKLN